VTEESFVERLRLEPLAGLRALRKALREEERQVGYWRRLVQGRLDLARAVLAGDQPSTEKLAAAAGRRSGSRGGQRSRGDSAGSLRRSPAFARFADGTRDRRLASLATVWDTPIPWDDHERLHQVERNLVEVEAELSGYRRDLHERIDACTAELVGRYRSDPGELKRLGPPAG